MSKKKIALTLCAVALTGVLAVGGSLAYFTDETEKVTNVFTTNDKELSGKIVESFDEDKAESFLPGDAIYKEPVLNNDADSINAWAAIKVDILIDDQVVSYNDFKNNYAVISYLENEGFNLNDFELIQGDYNSSASLVFAYKNIIESDNDIKVFKKGTIVENGQRYHIKNRYQLPYSYIEAIFKNPDILKKVLDAGSEFYSDRQRRLIFTQINKQQKYHYKTRNDLANSLSQAALDELIADLIND